ncbi:hypothetical protein BP5796_02117 [Coleophoma crateriformis]|uniref:Transcription factor domain-containing protein n=1 Tax=Coleophoma crateriformis TaxID=565419 RepID=A0A3D8SXA6_9HELO|nr:hypothetical protein BP5796_02117 [Coleophoma crateriformis]
MLQNMLHANSSFPKLQVSKVSLLCSAAHFAKPCTGQGRAATSMELADLKALLSLSSSTSLEPLPEKPTSDLSNEFIQIVYIHVIIVNLTEKLVAEDIPRKSLYLAPGYSQRASDLVACLLPVDEPQKHACLAERSRRDVTSRKTRLVDVCDAIVSGRLARWQLSQLITTKCTTTLTARLDALEKTVRELVSRLDPISAASHLSPTLPTQAPPHVACHNTETSTPMAAPVFLIRDAASDIVMEHSSSNDVISTVSKVHVDVISKGFLTAEQAISLLELFQEQYGRWVCIQKTENIHVLLSETRKSPLLLCACCLIAVRHKSQELATELAPLLFQEVKGLLSSSLLMIPQTIDFFQAVLILSMWSTTIGQVPLSIDSWLISGYALQQALSAGNLFQSTSSTIHARQPSKTDLDRMCIWNHLCLVHLQ